MTQCSRLLQVAEGLEFAVSSIADGDALLFLVLREEMRVFPMLNWET